MKNPIAMIFMVISQVYISRKTKSIVSILSVTASTSLSRARNKQFTIITNKINLSNQGFTETICMILFLNGFVTERQQSETVA